MKVSHVMPLEEEDCLPAHHSQDFVCLKHLFVK